MLDTNVLISALLFPGVKMDAMMNYIFTHHQLVLSSYVVDELKRVVKRKFRGKEMATNKLLMMMSFEYVYTPSKVESGLFDIRDAKDYPVLYTAIIDETIDCNPAKGTLMVRSTGEPVNLFFSYGKAVMTEHGSAAEDTGIDEIGIGYLGGGRLLYNTAHRYGAFYWSGSGYSNADTNMLFRDFWYSLNTNVPINVGTLNTNNGMFVRCVRSEK